MKRVEMAELRKDTSKRATWRYGWVTVEQYLNVKLKEGLTLREALRLLVNSTEENPVRVRTTSPERGDRRDWLGL